MATLLPALAVWPAALEDMLPMALLELFSAIIVSVVACDFLSESLCTVFFVLFIGVCALADFTDKLCWFRSMDALLSISELSFNFASWLADGWNARRTICVYLRPLHCLHVDLVLQKDKQACAKWRAHRYSSIKVQKYVGTKVFWNAQSPVNGRAIILLGLSAGCFPLSTNFFAHNRLCELLRLVQRLIDAHSTAYQVFYFYRWKWSKYRFKVILAQWKLIRNGIWSNLWE